MKNIFEKAIGAVKSLSIEDGIKAGAILLGGIAGIIVAKTLMVSDDDIEFEEGEFVDDESELE